MAARTMRGTRTRRGQSAPICSLHRRRGRCWNTYSHRRRRMDLDKYLPFADQPTPKAQEGTWTLVAPDGRKFTGPSPIQCVRAESKTRIPPHVALGRIARGMQEPEL